MFAAPRSAARAEADRGLRTYALLDAAKMPYILTSQLAASGLRYQSLFQGPTSEDLKERAPHLVELEKDNALTQKLFTGTKGVNGLWAKELGLFLRSEVGFDTLRKHFRKFTRFRDADGKWMLLHFWDPSFAEAGARHMVQLLRTYFSSPSVSRRNGATLARS
ncbi:DUF4123 domain-containing protein [Tritonibacter multivorans]|uniref:DUF4123 domain-containing protein n=1 Tax=Tritonibacter multivorans TaxID=928856 RepID=UPI0013F4E4FD|nr:DUF4123 domain-containing protein [Tritonibacter multivorans]MDA7423009.1 DUF4123 domain-containing protein [Tritonibacter multivorans]